MIRDQAKNLVNRQSSVGIAFVLWTGIALVGLIPVTLALQGSFPWLTVVWLLVPLLIAARARNTNRVGFQTISWRIFLSTAAINLGALLLISILTEPWSHAYGALVVKAISGMPPDTTFAWLVRFKGLMAWGGLFFYSGLVTIFAEELFFRGWLLQSLQRKMNRNWAILIQATLFTLPQLLAALQLAPFQGLVYAVIYSWLAIGVIGGWAALRTQSIWPSLVSATIWNVFMVACVL
jgi:membrane protease YdiL (CAAX protease family)